MTYRMLTTTSLIGLLAMAAAASAAAAGPAEADRRAAGTLAAMTLDEKIDLLHGSGGLGKNAAEKIKAGIPVGAGYVAGVPRLNIPPLVESDASLGVSNMGNTLRRGDTATALPSALAMGATWDTGLIERGGAAIGGEARAKGFNVLLAGGINLVREPRNGRNFEYFSEDPLLSGMMGGHAVRGVQSNGIVSTIKHFALNAQETGRMVLSANMGEAALRESDLLAFQIAIEVGDPGSVMCAYNRVNGVYACENPFLLNDVLRRDWGYKGWVMSDWGAVHSTASLRVGLDQQSGEQLDKKPYLSTLLRQEVDAGAASVADVDRAAGRILRTMYARGLVDRPIGSGGTIDYAKNGAVAQEIAEKGIVLLKNEGGVLPLAAGAKHVLVVGANAYAGVLIGGGSTQVQPVGGPALTLKRKTGYPFMVYAPSSPLKALQLAMPQASFVYDDGKDAARAAASARGADIVIMFAEQFAAEAEDVSLSLTGDQDALIGAVAKANPRTVVVLETGGAVLMPWLDQVPAVVAAWYSGQRGGDAIARVLTGAVNPSGRLPITFPAAISQLPNPVLPGAATTGVNDKGVYGVPTGSAPFDVAYPEGADAGYRWYERTRAKPLFPFGHGLSYTRFDYDALKVVGGATLTVTFGLRNSGDRAGSEVAQIYARVGGNKRLVGWSRVDLAPGERRMVTVSADPRLLARYDTGRRGWRIDGAVVPVTVGGSVADDRLTGSARMRSGFVRP